MVLDQQVTGRHVVVLGGGGFIGANLCNRLLALGAHVTAVDTVFPSWRRPDVMCRRADLTLTGASHNRCPCCLRGN